MSPHRGSVVAAALGLALLAGLGVAPIGDVAVADHGTDGADYTVEPMEPADRKPGATNVRYGQTVVGQADVDFETLERMQAVYEEGSWASCEGGDSEVFGIDRGNTHDGYEIDEDLTEYTKRFSTGEDVFEVEFYGEEDWGPTVHLNSGDAVVSVATCIDNPDEPGWYQISGTTTGVTEEGDRVTVGDESHFFWICDCGNGSEAREELGPPPSESTGPTPTPTSDDGGDEADGDGDSGGGDADEPADDDTTESNADGSDDAAAADGGGDAGSEDGTENGGDDAGSDEADDDGADDDGPTPTPGDWDRAVVDTPTPGDGDGFGVGVGLLAVVCAALLARGLD